MIPSGCERSVGALPGALRFRQVAFIHRGIYGRVYDELRKSSPAWLSVSIRRRLVSATTTMAIARSGRCALALRVGREPAELNVGCVQARASIVNNSGASSID